MTNWLDKLLDYILGVTYDREKIDPPSEESQKAFGPRMVCTHDGVHNQWRYGANRMADMACKTSDDLMWEYDESEDEYIVRHTEYDMERRENDLWRALWILERDVRIQEGTKFHFDPERRSY